MWRVIVCDPVACRSDGICIKMKTASGRNTPAIYIEDSRQSALKTVALSKSDELHFENRCAPH